MHRMVAIGPERFMLPFGAAGFEMIEADEASFAEVFEPVVKDPMVGLIVCGESFVGDAPSQEFRELCQTSRAAVMIVPQEYPSRARLLSCRWDLMKATARARSATASSV